MNLSPFSKMPALVLVAFIYFGNLGFECVRNGGSVSIQMDKLILIFSGQSKAK